MWCLLPGGYSQNHYLMHWVLSQSNRYMNSWHIHKCMTSVYNAWGKGMAHQVAEYAALAQVPPISSETYSSVSDA